MVEATKYLVDTLMSIAYKGATEFDALEILAVGIRKIQLLHWALVGVVCTGPEKVLKWALPDPDPPHHFHPYHLFPKPALLALQGQPLDSPYPSPCFWVEEASSLRVSLGEFWELRS